MTIESGLSESAFSQTLSTSFFLGHRLEPAHLINACPPGYHLHRTVHASLNMTQPTSSSFHVLYMHSVLEQYLSAHCTNLRYGVLQSWCTDARWPSATQLSLQSQHNHGRHPSLVVLRERRPQKTILHPIPVPTQVDTLGNRILKSMMVDDQTQTDTDADDTQKRYTPLQQPVPASAATARHPSCLLGVS